MNCPAGDVVVCQGHGLCLDMKSLAKFAIREGGEVVDAVGSDSLLTKGYDYGVVPNDPYTWDALRHVFSVFFQIDTCVFSY